MEYLDYLQPFSVIDVTPKAALYDVVAEKLNVTASRAAPFGGA